MRKRTLNQLAILILHSLFFFYATITLLAYHHKPTDIIKLELPKIKQNESFEIAFGKYKNEKTKKGIALAETYVGTEGDCYKIAIRFIEEYKGIKVVEIKPINENELVCGDIIFYKNGGLGTTHYAVYLDKDLALHGNVKGKTIISTIKLKNASKPKYYRAIGGKK